MYHLICGKSMHHQKLSKDCENLSFPGLFLALRWHLISALQPTFFKNCMICLAILARITSTEKVLFYVCASTNWKCSLTCSFLRKSPMAVFPTELILLRSSLMIKSGSPSSAIIFFIVTKPFPASINTLNITKRACMCAWSRIRVVVLTIKLFYT